MPRLVASLVLALASSSLVAANSKLCQLAGTPLGDFDLRHLQIPGSDYDVFNSKNGEMYEINFCGPVYTERTWEIAYPMLVGSYFEDHLGGVSLGRYAETPTLQGDQLSLTYTGGSPCANKQGDHVTIIHLQCDATMKERGEPKFVTSVDECTYVFSFTTPYACPISSSRKSSVGFIGALLYFLLCAIVIGFTSAVAYNRFVLKQRGADQIPSVASVKAAGALTKDVVIVGGIWALDLFQSAYERIPASRRPGVFLSGKFGNHVGASSDYTSGSWGKTTKDGYESVSAAETNGPPVTEDVTVGSLFEVDDDAEEREVGTEGYGAGKASWGSEQARR